MYLPKDRVVVPTQHVKNIETLDKTQNEQVQRLYLSDDDDAAKEAPAGNTARPAEAGNPGRAAEAGDAEETQVTCGCAKSGKRRGKKSKKKKGSTRDRPGTRSTGKRAENEVDESAQREETGQDVVNNVFDENPRYYREAMRSKHKTEVVGGDGGGTKSSGRQWCVGYRADAAWRACAAHEVGL
ncbi:hypothetical protein PI124_g13810 [Phytophthora idaei]|nr:hypothetical protein PI125_g17375 [Phytophthora idaei]KAG3141283.1 hypothetical protein PI126_g15575 [Phytophthora idaei]KAG3241316.1 hypothetical protein PI124_g13810 [Phytophthora idaei]